MRGYIGRCARSVHVFGCCGGLTFAASVAVGLLLFQLYRASTIAQVGQAEAVVQQACYLVRDRYAFYVTGWSGAGSSPTDPRFRQDLVPVLNAALAHQAGVEGGIWSGDTGSLAYAFPTYPGTRPKTDFPTAESASITTVNAEAARAEQPVLRRSDNGSQTPPPCGLPLAGSVYGHDRLDDGPCSSSARIRPAGFRPRPALRPGSRDRLAWVTWLTSVWGRHVAPHRDHFGHA